jgi:lysophospholipase L1-like esterase
MSSSFEPESAVVRWRGLPGWTASAMAEYMDDSTIGLRSALDGVRNPSLSLVIILAGTNDIGSITSSSSMNNTTESVSLVVDPILRLHNTCLDYVVGDSGKKDVYTLIIGIPGSAWQQMNSQAARLCSDVNGALKQFASSYSSEEGGRKRRRVKYIDFPFPYQRDDNKWCGDGLHLSPEGYKTLGTSLAPCVKEMLDEMRLMGVEE